MAQSVARQVNARSLACRIGSERYGLRAERIVEVLRPPPITRVPHAPPALAGIANLRGQPLPVIAVARLAGLSSAAGTGGQKLVVYEADGLVGLLVDDVSKFGDGSEDLGLLDIEALLQEAFKARVRTTRPASLRAQAERAAGPDGQVRRALLAFRVDGQIYALPLDAVSEIVARPAEMVLLPGTDAAVLGLINLRDGIVPVVSLANLLGLAGRPAPLASDRVVIVGFAGTQVGFMVDAMEAIRHLDETAIDAVPALLNRGGGRAEIEAIGRADGGQMLISILSPEKLFANGITGQAMAKTAGAAHMSIAAPVRTIREQFLIFQLGEETYGLPIAAVDEVIRVPDSLTRLPNAPAFVAGIINLRGKPLPLIDQRQRFETPGAAGTGKPRALVLTIDRLQAGFVVDAVSEVLAVAAGDISPAPDFSSERAEVFDRVAHVEADGRMILLIDPKELLTHAERDAVAELAAAKSASSAP